jgi:hypothetical protein
VRFFRPGGTTKPQTLEPTPSEAFVQREFADAILFGSEAWLTFEAGFKKADPQWPDKFSLAQRLAAFMAGPIGAALEERFPAIAATGAAADEMTDRTGNRWVITALIVAEAVIAAGGGSRGEVRSALRI